MIHIYRTDKQNQHKVEEIEKIENLCWIEMTNPTEEEIKEIASKTK